MELEASVLRGVTRAQKDSQISHMNLKNVSKPRAEQQRPEPVESEVWRGLMNGSAAVRAAQDSGGLLGKLATIANSSVLGISKIYLPLTGLFWVGAMISLTLIKYRQHLAPHWYL